MSNFKDLLQEAYPQAKADTPVANTAQSAGKFDDLLKEAYAGGPAADETIGAPFLTRVRASFKSTPQGKLEYLESEYGKGNVHEHDGDYYFKDKDGQVKRFNPRGLDIGDIGDMAAPAVKYLPPVIGGLATHSPMGAALGGAGGEAMRQMLEHSLPGQNPSDSQDLWELAKAGLVAGGTKAAANAVGMAGRAAAVGARKVLDPEALAKLDNRTLDKIEGLGWVTGHPYAGKSIRWILERIKDKYAAPGGLGE